MDDKIKQITAGDGTRILRNEDVRGIIAEVPQGHRHLRTVLILADGSRLTLQEATVAAMVRAYVAVKTDPLRQRVSMIGGRVPGRKAGYAEWQLLEEEREVEGENGSGG